MPFPHVFPMNFPYKKKGEAILKLQKSRKNHRKVCAKSLSSLGAIDLKEFLGKLQVLLCSLMVTDLVAFSCSNLTCHASPVLFLLEIIPSASLPRINFPCLIFSKEDTTNVIYINENY